MTGIVIIVVIFSFSTVLHTATGSKSAIRTVVLPLCKFKMIGINQPIWKKGATDKKRSCAHQSMVCDMPTDAANKLRWVIIAPFGFPVVPEVYIINVVSSSLEINSGSSA